MAASGVQNLPKIGFFTITEHEDWGIAGGLLVLNASGRPLEFHCTAPVKPNRAQEILYGPTLRPFVYGEQIGVTLATKAKSDTLFLCTDIPDAMCLREHVDSPLVLICSESADTASTATTSRRIDGPHAAHSRHLQSFQLGKHAAAVLSTHAEDRSLACQRWEPFDTQFDLNEPFHRVREALLEAQRGAAK